MKYGRLKRTLDVIPHLKQGPALPAPPASISWSDGMPKSLGEYFNDSLGCCTSSAIAHAIQLWSFHSNPPLESVPAEQILKLYEATSGYVVGDPATDNGADMQTVLEYMLTVGIPANKLSGASFVEPNEVENVQRAIAWTGLAYVGFDVPSYMTQYEAPGSVWDVHGNRDNAIIGGHCVILTGYKNGVYDLISWGSTYKMTQAFYDTFVDECYALADTSWINAQGMDPEKASLTQLLVEISDIGKPMISPQRRHRHHRRVKRRNKA